MRLRWQIGDVRITRVQEFEAPGIGFILPEATRENLATIDWIGPWVNARGETVGSVHSGDAYRLEEVNGR